MSAREVGPGVRRGRAHRRGTALIIVLYSLALILFIVLPFLLLSRSQLNVAKSSAQEDGVRQLADRCVNTVIAQLTDATSGGAHLAWASQPGAVRTYDDTGAAVTAYKLFSSDNMRVAGAYNPAADLPPSNWSQQQGLYTDLNEPVAVSGAGSYTAYPIIDPAAYNPGNPSQGIEGFSIAATAPVTTANPLPMPVRWLYVLQDGTLAVPSAGTGGGDSATVSGATADNPIVGRIAFWTDDETCKVNVNTSSEGTFWDTPRAEGATERNYAKFQPATGEFQRYPGHPAMTSLSGIFPALAGASGYPEILYPLIPRLSAGGSAGGTQSPGAALVPNGNRLYGAIDEFMFTPARTPNSAQIDNAALQKAKFFITTNSRAPEVNLFNKPRVTIWPVHADLASNPASPYTTVTDRLIAFCSTMRNDLPTPYRYYFQRKDPDTQTGDIGIARNQELYQYLHRLTALPVPGFGGQAGQGVLSKYGTDQDQILTEIFDYIRTTNLLDGNLSAGNMYAPTRPASVGIDLSQFPAFAGFPVGQGLVLPTSYLSNGTNTRGFGRFPTVSKVGLMLIVTGDNTTDPSIPSTQVDVQAAVVFDMFDPSLGWTGIFGGYTLRVSGLASLQWGPDSSSATSMGFSDGDLDIVQNSGDTINGSDYSGRMGFRYPLFGRGFPTVAPAFPFQSSPLRLTYGPGKTLYFGGGNVTIEIRYNNRGTLVQTLHVNLPSGTFPVPTTPPAVAGANFYSFPARFLNNNTALGLADAWSVIRPGDVVETVQCASGDVRLIAGRQTVNVGDPLYARHPDYGTAEPYAHSLYYSGPGGYYGASQGRLVPNVTYTTSPRDSFYSSAVPDVPAPNGVFIGGLGNPPGSSGTVPGDWDNAIANAPDGPYINKVDEGNTLGLTSGKVPYFDQSTAWAQTATTFFSPNRQVPSPGMFGSLPTGVQRALPWQTLLFRPGPAGHPGAGAPAGGPVYTTLPDFLLMDLFQMPVAQPYPISEPLSTAGKVNMNYQIVPFTYITRETAIRAAMKKEMIMAIPNGDGQVYKTSMAAQNYRHPIDMTETLKGFQKRFAAPDIFRSAAEICSLPLVPSGLGATYAGMGTFWSGYGLTGDNTQERPYADLYQRLTTKSNTYTVHFRVQLLLKPKQRRLSAPTEFSESQGDTVAAEYRGSSVVERYVDPNDANLPDFADPANADAVLDGYYRYHVLSAKQFNP